MCVCVNSKNCLDFVADLRARKVKVSITDTLADVCTLLGVFVAVYDGYGSRTIDIITSYFVLLISYRYASCD